MIVLTNKSNVEITLKCVKATGTFKFDEIIPCTIQHMTGKVFKLGKDKNGKWLDKEGEPDNRLMVYGRGSHNRYSCISPKTINEYFQEVL